MKASPCLLLLLIAMPIRADAPPPPSADVERIHDFAGLLQREAVHLHGRRARFRIRLNTEADSEPGRVLYDCLGNDETPRGIRFIDGVQVENDQEEMIVEATFEVVPVHPFGSHAEYHLDDARRCRD